jgi:small subunit ribosomal protein S12
MSTLNQIFKKRKKKINWKKSTMTNFLRKNPQKKGICIRIYTTKPKKPHSAIRKIAKLYLPSAKRYVLAYIPGQAHNLSAHSVVLIRGGRVRDIPGMHARIYRNKYDFLCSEPFVRQRRRSKYGLSLVRLLPKRERKPGL